ncbi:MAG TPA: DEAD/DEAH box helicase [Candidatus Limiplasma sp.]|nr:DEAD/DEAH box helicase [Candidatus Limiplasma sp.]
MASFVSLNIIPPILRALDKENYKEPTPIQAQAIPPLLERRDLLGCAQTGTGKTAAFAIPILQQLHQEKAQIGRRTIQALILSPTRELATQISTSFSAYGAYLGLKNTVVFGGVSQVPQVKQLNAGVDILVATPGRLLDLMGQKVISLKSVRYFVLDEADRMLDMGFLHDVEKVIAQLPTQRQTMLFSATMPAGIEKLTRTILNDPVKVAVTPVSSTVDTIDQSVYFVNKQNKIRLLIHLLKDPSMVSALVFSRTKHGADKIARKLTQAGIAADVIHSNKSQNARQRALDSFKSGQTRVLVATDIVARGIDIDELSHVVNFDLPEVPEAYVHRIGRTARAGLTGTAIAFCDESEKKLLKQIEKLIGKPVPVVNGHPYPLVVMDTPVLPQQPKPAPRKSNTGRYYGKPRRQKAPYKANANR